MHKILQSIAAVSFALAGLATAQIPEQVADLKGRIQSAWEAGDKEAFESLYSMDGSSKEIREMTSMMWVRLKENKQTTIESIQYFTKESAKDPGTNKKLADSMERALVSVTEQKKIKDVNYKSNLEPIGIVVIVLKGAGGLTKLHPVGIKEGKLFFPSMRIFEEG